MFNKIYESIKRFIIENKVFLIFLIFFIFFLNFKLDYIIYTPGGYISLNDRLEVSEEYELEGSYNMAYVSMVYATPATYLLSYIIPNWDLEDIDSITLEGQSIDELEEYQSLNMESSFDLATISAYNLFGEKIENIESILNVMYIFPDANTDLEVGDVILSVNNILNPTLEEITNYLADKSVGDIIEITVLRDNENIVTTSKLVEIYDKPMIGISFIETYSYTVDNEIFFDFKNGESGPSGGFMMSLAIYTYLCNEDLTNGLDIVGTGTIDINGNVGKIDGVKYKILGSKDADIFFCPDENYEEAKSVIEEYDLDIKLYSVSTLEEAVELLKVQ